MRGSKLSVLQVLFPAGLGDLIQLNFATVYSENSWFVFLATFSLRFGLCPFFLPILLFSMCSCCKEDGGKERCTSLALPELGALLYLLTRESFEISLVCLIYALVRIVSNTT